MKKLDIDECSMMKWKNEKYNWLMKFLYLKCYQINLKIWDKNI